MKYPPIVKGKTTDFKITGEKKAQQSNQIYFNTFIEYRSNEGLTHETSAFQIFHGGNSSLMNSFEKTQF